MHHTAARPLAALLAAIIPAAALAQDLTWKAPPQANPIAIINAAVHPVSGSPIPRGYIFFDQGVIRALGPMADEPVFIGTTQIIDADGLHIYPGLIAPVTDLGSWRSRPPGLHRPQRTQRPELRGLRRLLHQPDSWLFPVARSGGILLAGTFHRRRHPRSRRTLRSTAGPGKT